MVAAHSIHDANTFHQVLDELGPVAIRKRFGRHAFSTLQSAIDSDESLAFRLANILASETHGGTTSHVTNNIAYWLGRSTSQPFLTDILRSFRSVESHDGQLQPEFMRSHLITLGNMLGDGYVRQFIRQLSLRPYFETNLGYYYDYYGSLPAALNAILGRLTTFTYPNCLLDLHTLYHSLDLFHGMITDDTRDLLSAVRASFEPRERNIIDRCLVDTRSASRHIHLIPHQSLGSRLYMYDAFVSHASEDKDDVARPISEGLVEAGFDIWFDEYALSVGDSLRAKIDAGLAASKYGIFVLSPSFFAKGWPQAELDGLFSLQLSGRSKLIPIVHRLSHDELLGYSPMLAGRLYLKTSDGIRNVIDNLIYQLT